MGKSIRNIAVVTRVGLDLAKNAFQVHAVDAKGETVVARKLARGRLVAFFAELPSCVVAMEACSSAHHWGRRSPNCHYGDSLLNPATLGFGPRRLGRGSRPVAAARRLRNAAEPSGRPIVSAARSADSASADASVSMRSAKPAGATLKKRRDGHEAVVAPRQMRANARPAPVFRPFDKPRPHRVHRQVARRRHQVLLVHRDRAEPRLEQMAGHPEAGVDRRRVAPMRLAERAPERLLAVGDENEVNVVGHQTIGPDRHAVLAALVRQEIAIERIVVVAKEDALAPVAALA